MEITLTDTLASDENCLYHALALTLHVSHKQLRSKTMEAIAAMKGVPVAHAHNQAGGHHHAHGHKDDCMDLLQKPHVEAMVINMAMVNVIAIWDTFHTLQNQNVYHVLPCHKVLCLP